MNQNNFVEHHNNSMQPASLGIFYMQKKAVHLFKTKAKKIKAMPALAC
ncbi:MAG: hypothetical protein JSU03_04760 [Bacteroidetes bacterium]|nr:hypothetical protein [Bacteroidota bacterium]MBS1756566.1 hypothetical protein [Bacteroidota bacterium]